MNDSKQLRVLKKLTEHLEGITPANGYESDLAGRVFRGRSTFGSDTPTPALSILEAPKPELAAFAAENNRMQTFEWTLLLQGWVDDDKKHPTDPAYGLKAEVEKRLSAIIAVKPNSGSPVDPAAYLLGNLISGLNIGPGVVRPPDQISSKAYFYLPLQVSLVVNVSEPFVAD